MEKNVKPKKKIGQHFLSDNNIAKKIIDLVNFKNHRHIVEVGPGMGALTDHLVDSAKNLTLIEIDNECIEYLEKKYLNKNLEIVSANFLKYDLKNFKNNEILIIGNFPYNISSQIIFKVIENRDIVSSLTGMFQKEVASRICSDSGSKTYGILSVLTQLFFDVKIHFDVSPNVFNPKPKVNSSVLSLQRKKSINIDCDEKLLFKIVKLSFQQRRKKIKNSLKNGMILTDVGSVKEKVMGLVEKAVPKDVSWISSHPIAGTEESGPEAGFSELFKNRWCILTPSKKAKEKDINTLKSFWKKIGSKVDIMDAKQHDYILSITSHIPHLVAYNIVNTSINIQEEKQSD
ncbi:16S rRNA (adenine(1518)-N(6)/adenine(1519)-N(6))-dimethyltransferase RsmA, partial [Mesonia mobilis]|uniref:16S rRNA (adenine(1518)-N(6)/adenine(1519)-N(6))- dimethyltransferase RsmA n=1 Tax=Mesonia mobilis TaxID=369791 RepID=UPI0026F187CA